MAIPLLLQVGAIPFTDSALASRRSSRNTNQGSTNQNRPQQPIVTSTLSLEQRAMIGELMSEAAQAINDVIRNKPPTASICVNTDLSVPPNTPSSSSNSSTIFEFPEATLQNILTSSSEDEAVSTPQRPQRKRRRPPSFKKQHRVVPKKSVDADDEESDPDLLQNDLELQLKLGIISQSQNSSADSDSSKSQDESDDENDKWAKIGEELRHIADKFGSPLVDETESETELANPFQVTDLLSLVNLMLPFSVPQSLWSALVSYAAWKIFKRFQ